VRPDAEVYERVGVFDDVARDVRLAGGLLFDELHLQRLAARGEERLRLLTRPHLPLVRQVGCGELAHLALDCLEVLRHERAIDDEVVEEAVVGRGTNAALRVREERGHGRGQQVRGAVTVQRERFRRALSDDADAPVGGERAAEIHQAAVHGGGERRRGEARRNRSRDVTHRRSGGHAPAGAVWQRGSHLAHGTFWFTRNSREASRANGMRGAGDR
jgi:hypothetical protein